MGINTDQVYARTYALNAAICGAAGGLVAMIWAVQAYGGLVYTVRAFMIVILAGLGNLFGVIVAGLGLGAAENLAGFILGLEFQIAFVFGLLVVVLIYRRIRLSFARKVLS
jgi:branched-chain amino acid transport system permease protein